jgi:hypothetical protein
MRADGTAEPGVQSSLPPGVAGVLLVCLGVIATGCGAPAAPQPPTLNLPQPLPTLTAERSGNTVRLSFSTPPKTTDRLPVRGTVTARLCRRVDEGPCTPAATAEVKPAMAVALEDKLPAELSGGAPRLLSYQVALENSGGKFAPPAETAYAAAGQPPAPVAGFTATPRRNGIVLGWSAAQDPMDASELLVERNRVGGPPPPAPKADTGLLPGEGASAEDAEPLEQTLRVHEERAGGKQPAALDATARTGRSYRYTARRIAHIALAGHSLEVASAPSAPVMVDYRDIFPPPAPTGLVSAVDTPGHAIDLTWAPAQDPHLRGYVVYRRSVDANSSATPEQLTPAGKPVPVTAWSDTTAVPGRHYAYSVSAVDPAGNESPRSAEVEDTLPAPDAQP